MQGTALETRGEVTATAYDASGTRMVTSTAAGAVHVWDRTDDVNEGGDGAPGPWRQTAAWAAHESCSCEAIAFAPSEFGQCVATAAVDGSVRVWREQPLVPLGVSAEAAREAAANAATAASEGTAQWELVADLRAARGATRHLDFAPPAHGLQLASGGVDGVVRFYSPNNTLGLMDWELTNEHEPLRPNAECTSLKWRRPTAADEVRVGFANENGNDSTSVSIPPALCVGLAWYDTNNVTPIRAINSTTENNPPGVKTCEARVLTYDDLNAKWRNACMLFDGGEETPPASAVAWAPNADASPAGEVDIIAAAVGAEVRVFRVEGLRGEDEAMENTENTENKTRCHKAATLSHPGKVLDLDWNTVGTTLATSAADGVVRVWAANMQTGVWEARAQLVGE